MQQNCLLVKGKLSIVIAFVAQQYFKVPKEIRFDSIHNSL